MTDDMSAADLAEMMMRVADHAGASPRRMLEAVELIIDICERLIEDGEGKEALLSEPIT